MVIVQVPAIRDLRAISCCILLLILSFLTSCSGGDFEEETAGYEPTQVSLPSATQPVASLTQPAATPDPAVYAAEALAELEQGRILYNPPSEMQLGETERVEVRIGLNSEISLDEGLKGSGDPVTEQIPVAAFMAVRLAGTAFEITPLSSEEQLVANDTFTQWAWDIMPTEAGHRNLTLIVTARVKIPGFADEARDLPIIERDILVKVSPLQSATNFIKENPEWIAPPVLAVLAAILGWAWRQRSKLLRHSSDD